MSAKHWTFTRSNLFLVTRIVQSNHFSVTDIGQDLHFIIYVDIAPGEKIPFRKDWKNIREKEMGFIQIKTQSVYVTEALMYRNVISEGGRGLINLILFFFWGGGQILA